MHPGPEVEKTSSISAIWLLPFIALCIGAWIAYTSYRDAGVTITITFDDATGIVPAKTRVMAKGIPVGMVKKVIPDLGAKTVKVVVEMDKLVAPYLVEDTLFWVVRPELSASSVRGLDTILSGSYIGLQAGSSAQPRKHFTGLSSAPPVPPTAPGLHVRLRAEKLGSIQAGTGIYYRNIEIGAVQSYSLEADDSILIDLFIEPSFSHLVRSGSRFCNASGVQIGGKLPNLKIQVESLASLLRGGILLHTPQQLQDTPPAKNGQVFPLYPDYDSANFGIPMSLNLTSGEDIVEGATKVMYRGLEAGFVKEIEIRKDRRHIVTAHIMLDPRAEIILRENTTFWLEKPEIAPSGVKNLRLLLSGAYITFRPGDGKFRDHFDILPEPPAEKPLRPGKSFLLHSPGPNKVAPRSPVYYQNVQVGEVVEVQIDRTSNELVTTVFIYRKNLDLISEHSVFWVHSGLRVQAGLDTGFHLDTDPIGSMVRGGISFVTPDLTSGKRTTPEENHTFFLYPSEQEARSRDPLLVPKGIHFQLIADTGHSLSVGSPILHKKIRIGEVMDFRLAPKKNKVLIDCFVHWEHRDVIRKTTRFFNSSGIQFSGGINGLQVKTGSLQSILAGGIGCVNLIEEQGTGGKPASSPYPLYADLQEALNADNIPIRVRFQEIDDLKVGGPVRYKGIRVGRVTKLDFSKDLQTIIGEIRVNKNVAPLFRQNTRIWVENAKIDLSGVKNLDTIVFGSYLSFLPGEGPPRTEFTADREPPRTLIANSQGLGIVLETSHLGSLSVNSPIYYRQVQIGRITGWELSPSFQKVLVYGTILPRYRHIIRENTRFWNVSGTRVEGGLFSGLTIATESLEAFMRGGVALATPDNEVSGPPVGPGHHFPLFEEAKPEWLDWSPDLVLLRERDGADGFYEDAEFDEK